MNHNEELEKDGLILRKEYNVSIIKDGIVLLAENKWDSLMKKFKKDGITLISSNEF